MTEYELLLYAAKAIGLQIEYNRSGNHFWVENRYTGIWWDPLNDDADAFRLAVLANINTDHIHTVHGKPIEKYAYPHGNRQLGYACEIVDDPFQAMRTAIVCSAALIGKSME